MASSHTDVHVQLANDLLAKLHIDRVLTRLEDVDWSVFVMLYEGLVGDQLKDVFSSPCSRQEEVHNCQSVIDALSLDVLQTSLSHITGEDIVDGDRTAVANLLDVFGGLMDFILTRIDSEVSDSEVESERNAAEPIQVSEQLKEPDVKAEGSSAQIAQISWDHDDVPEVTRDTDFRLFDSETFLQRDSRKRSDRRYEGLIDDKSSGSTLELIQESEAIQQTLHQRPYSLCRRTDHVTDLVTPPDATSQPHPATSRVDGRLSTRDQQPQPALSLGVYKKGSIDEGKGDSIYIGNESRSSSKDVRGASTYSGFSERERPLRGNRGTSDGIQGASTHAGYTLRDRQYKRDTSTAPSAEDGHSVRIRSSGSSPVSLDSVPTGQDAGEFTTLGTRPHTDHTESTSKERLRGDRYPKQERSSEQEAQKFELHHYVHFNNDGGKRHAQTNVPVNFSSSAPDISRQSTRPVASLRSYDHLDRLIKSTAAMSRQALDTSPLKADHQHKKIVRDKIERLQEHREQLQRLSQSLQGPGTSRTLKGPGTSQPLQGPVTSRMYNNSNSSEGKLHKQRQQSQVKPRKVTFASDKHSPDLSVDDLSSEFSHQRRYPLVSKKTSAPTRNRGDYYDRYSRDEVHRSEDELSTHSDGVLNYGTTTSEEDVIRSPPRKTRKQRSNYDGVQGVSERSSYTGLQGVTDRLARDNRLTRAKTRILNKKLQQDYEDFANENDHDLRNSRSRVAERNDEYWKAVRHDRSKVRRRQTGASKKSVLLPPKKPFKSEPKQRKRSASCSPTVCRNRQIKEDEDILPFMLEEFPFLHLSNETSRKLWWESGRQIEQMTRAAKEAQRKKSKAQVELEEAQKRQEILMAIMKKDLTHTQRLREVKNQKLHQINLKGRLRDRRLQSARSRRYYDEYQVRQRSKMLQRRTKEEMIFKRLFKEGIEVQKERLKECRKYAKEEREKYLEKHKNELESLENYYRDQFSMVAESLAREKRELKIQNEAQTKILSQMKKELRKKMEKEIRDFQQQMQRDEDDEYFRQLDADRVKERLQMALYATSRM